MGSSFSLDLEDLRTDDEDEGFFVVELPEAELECCVFNDLWRRGPLVDEAVMDGFTTF